ncbi:MAG: hypothetical protein V3V20_09815 [Algisphaera sp.]
MSSSSLLEKNHFILRRLHSLSGILPIGLFVIAHLFTNAQMIWGQDATTGEGTFQHEVNFIHSLPALFIIEWSLWGAIGFHAILGFWYTFTGKHNVTRYSYADNVRYVMQRLTGVIALVFIFLHIATLRWRWDLFGWFTPFYGEGYQAPGVPHAFHDVPMSLPLTAYALQFSWFVVVVYAVGVTASVYHWCNGLWTAAISWGLTITTASMKRWGFVCAGLFIALMTFFAAAMLGALKFDLGHDMSPEQMEVFELIVENPRVPLDVTNRKRGQPPVISNPH